MAHIFYKCAIDNDGITRHLRVNILVNGDAIPHKDTINFRYNAIRVNLVARNAARCLTPSAQQYKTREHDKSTHNTFEPPTRAFLQGRQAFYRLRKPTAETHHRLFYHSYLPTSSFLAWNY